jgi:type II secretory pathway component GspD/PulD (secretin)
MNNRKHAFSLLSLLATGAWGQAKLTGIETTQVGDGLKIVIRGESLPKPRVQRILKDTSYILEFDAGLGTRGGRKTVGFARVKYVQWGWYTNRPPRVRVHVKTTAAAKPELVHENGAYVVKFGVTSRPVDSPTTPLSGNELADRIAMLQAVQQLDRPGQAGGPANNGPLQWAPADILASHGTAPSAPLKGKAAPSGPPKQPHSAAAPTVTGPSRAVNPSTEGPKVSLDFVGTDVVQILKALSIQAGVNIVASPEVSPSDKPTRLTISLHNVTLEDALTFVTTMSGLRYARVGNTFVVTPSGSFSNAMRQIMERGAENYETRVINLVSGEADRIREAALKAMPQDGRNGFYDIVVPSNAAQSGPKAVPQATTSQEQGLLEQIQGAAAGEKTAQPQPQTAPTPPPSARRDFYLLLVGDRGRLDAVEKYIRDLDQRIASTFSLDRSRSMSTVVVPIQSGQTERIKTMIDKLLAENPRAADFSITETSIKELDLGEVSTKLLLMIGPGEEISTIEKFARALDMELCRTIGLDYAETQAQFERVYEVVELTYLEPVIAAFDLKGRFKGLWVTVVPDPVTPGIMGEDEGKKEEAPTDSADGKTGAQKVKETELKRAIGREPMRLILRGTRSIIESAKQYLAKIDVAPRQIALELRVMELTKEEALRLGIDWNLLMGSRGHVFRLNQGLGDSSATSGTLSGTRTGGIKIDPVTGQRFAETASFLGTLDAISNSRNLIARPNALVSDGRSTDLFVGDTIRYIKQIQATQNGTTVIVDEIEVGSKFRIKARIGDKGSIALDLEQTFSVLNGFTPVPGGGNLPQTSDRSSKMFVNMQSGETIALGGLILDNDRKSVSGIPILKDLPIIGKLFSRTDNRRVRTEIVFFLTAVEVQTDNRENAASPRRNAMAVPDPRIQYQKDGTQSKP